MGVGLYQTLHPGDRVRSRTAGVMNGVIGIPRRERREDDREDPENRGREERFS
jgi:hypothetical protein